MQTRLAILVLWILVVLPILPDTSIAAQADQFSKPGLVDEATEPLSPVSTIHGEWLEMFPLPRFEHSVTYDPV